MFVGLQRTTGRVGRPSAPAMSDGSGAAFESTIQQSQSAQSCSGECVTLGKPHCREGTHAIGQLLRGAWRGFD